MQLYKLGRHWTNSKFLAPFSTGRVLYGYAQRTNKNAKKKGAFLSSSNRFHGQRQMMSEEGDPGQCSKSSHFFSAFALLVFFMFLIASQTLPAYGSILQVNVRLQRRRGLWWNQWEAVNCVACFVWCFNLVLIELCVLSTILGFYVCQLKLLHYMYNNLFWTIIAFNLRCSSKY